MEDHTPLGLTDIVASVRASPRYRGICLETVERIARDESRRRPDPRAAAKATRRKLHQIAGAFGSEPPYARILAALRAAYDEGDPADVEAACRDALRWHASTRERLPILDTFYDRIFAVTGQPRAVLDLGCGLNPLTIPWMRLPPGAAYCAWDVAGNLIAFVNQFLVLAGFAPSAEVRDVVSRPPTASADVVFLLKVLPTLDQQGIVALDALDALTARFVVASYPVKSLGGREKGMVRNYDRQFEAALRGRPWGVQRLEFATELVYIIGKEGW